MSRILCTDDLRSGFELEDAEGLLGPVVIVTTKSVMKLPVLLSRWASAKLS